MPKIGAKLPYVAAITSDTDTEAFPKYAEKMLLGKLVEANVTLNFNDVEFYADDVLSEEDHSFSDGELTVTVDDLTEEVEEVIYNKTAEEDGLEFGETDTSGYVGATFFKTVKRSGVISYVGYFFPKLAAVPQGESLKTKEKSITFEGEQVKFKVRAAANGVYLKKQRFATYGEAVTWCGDMLKTAE